MNMKSAQVAFVILTVLFLLSAMTLFLTETAIIAGVFCLLISVIGFVVFMAMLASDAGMSRTPPEG